MKHKYMKIGGIGFALVLGVALAMPVPVQAEQGVSGQPQILQHSFMVLAQKQSDKKCTSSEMAQCSDAWSDCQNGLNAKYGVSGSGAQMGQETAKCHRAQKACIKQCGGR